MSQTEKTVIRPDLSKYKSARSASGAISKNNGDAVAVAIEGMNIAEVKAVASAAGFEDVDKYNHLNIGQQRMNLGNRIRGCVAKHEKEKEKNRVIAADALPPDAARDVKDKHKAASAFMKKWADKDFLEVVSSNTRRSADKRIADEAKEKKAAADAKAKAKAEKTKAEKGEPKKAA